MFVLPVLVTVAVLAVRWGLGRWRAQGRSGPVGLWGIGAWTPWALTFVAAASCVLSFPALVEVEQARTGVFALSAAMLVALPAALARGQVARWIAALSIVVVTLITLSDVVFWRFFGGLVPLLAASSGGQLWDIRESVWALFEARDAALLALFALAGVALIPAEELPVAPPARLARWFKTAEAWRRAVHAAGIAVVALSSWGAVFDVHQYLGHRYSWKVFESLNSVVHVGVGSAHLRDIARSARERWQERPATPAELEDHIAWYHARHQPLSESGGFGEFAGANVLVVQVEALQAWVVDAKVNGAEITPFLNQLSEQGRYYPHFYDQTGASPTSDCEYLVLNSQHPLDRGSVAFRRPSNDFVTVPKLLAAKGYTTLSAHAYRRGMWNRAMLHPRYGFERSLFARELGEGPKMGWGLSDEVFFERLVDELKVLKGPFFTFAITLTSHHPYKYIPPERRVLNTKGLRGALEGYVHSMHYVDEAIRGLFAALARSGLDKNTVVVIYGDHDAKLKFGAKRRKRARAALGLSKATVIDLHRRAFRTDRVPFWIVPPAAQRREQIVDAVGGQIDIGPTLLHALGVAPSAAFLGRPLLGPGGVAVRHDGAAATPELMWIDEGEDAGRCERVADRKPVDAAQCATLRAEASEELRRSWAVTLQNLASVIDAHSASPVAGHEGNAG